MSFTVRTFKGLEMNEMVIGFTMLSVYVLFGLLILAVAVFIGAKITPVRKGDDEEIHEQWTETKKQTFTGNRYVSATGVTSTTVGARRFGFRFAVVALLLGYLSYLGWAYINPVLEWVTYLMLKIISGISS